MLRLDAARSMGINLVSHRAYRADCGAPLGGDARFADSTIASPRHARYQPFPGHALKQPAQNSTLDLRVRRNLSDREGPQFREPREYAPERNGDAHRSHRTHELPVIKRLQDPPPVDDGSRKRMNGVRGPGDRGTQAALGLAFFFFRGHTGLRRGQHFGRVSQQVPPPAGYISRPHVELPRDLCKRTVACKRSKGDFSLERRGMSVNRQTHLISLSLPVSEPDKPDCNATLGLARGIDARRPDEDCSLCRII